MTNMKTPDVFIRNRHSCHPARVVRKTEKTCTVAYLATGNQRRFNFRQGVNRYCESGCTNIYTTDYLEFDLPAAQAWIDENNRIREIKRKLLFLEAWITRKIVCCEFTKEEQAAIESAHSVLCP